ncbi:MAG: hypothetical protein R2939_21115, partial [Kofleriaceae bacterium]
MDAAELATLGGDVRLAGLAKRVSLPPARPVAVDGEEVIGDPAGTAQGELVAFPMQLDLYGRVESHGVSVNLTVGGRGSTRGSQTEFTDRVAAREAYVMPSDSGSYVRAGRFMPIYGLRSQDHTAYVRRYLGQHTLAEPLGVAVGTQRATWEAHLSAFMPTPAALGTARARAFAAYYERRGWDDTAALGLQARLAQVSGADTTLAIGAVGKRWLPEAELMVLAEVDLQQQRFDGAEPARLQLAGYLGLSRFLAPGVMLGGALQHWDPDLGLRASSRQAAELNLQYFPLAHVELHLLGRAEAVGQRPRSRLAAGAVAAPLLPVRGAMDSHLLARAATPWRRLGFAALAVGGAVAAPACVEPDRAAEPTWADVAPILAANCVRCHGAPAIGGAPGGFRLDSYGDALGPDGRLVRGAATMAEFVAARVADGSMPPIGALSDDQVALLTRWSQRRFTDEDNQVIPPPRGEARAGNRTPTLQLLARADDDAGIELDYELLDADRDLVVGELWADDDAPATPPRLLGAVHGGRGTLRWDVALVPAGTYELTLRVDDGAGAVTLLAGDVEVEHDDPPPPRITLEAPAAGDILADAASPHAVIVRPASLTTAALTVDVGAGGEATGARVELATDAPAVAGDALTVPWPTTELAAGARWQLELTVSDGAASHTVRSAPVTISHVTTSETFATISRDIL